MSHNITRAAVEHDYQAQKHAGLSVISRSQNISFRVHSRHITPLLVLTGGTGVLIANLSGKALRKESVQPAHRRGQPFYSPHSSPPSLERSFILDVANVQGPVSNMNPSVHDGGLYA